MFDVSFTELLLVGAIALVVIGPERLPKVARTVGHLLGRAQRYVTDVKKDIQKEMDLSELNSLKGQMEEAAKSVQASMKDASDTVRKPLDEAQQALKDASASVESLLETAKETQDETEGKDSTIAIAAEAPPSAAVDVADAVAAPIPTAAAPAEAEAEPLPVSAPATRPAKEVAMAQEAVATEPAGGRVSGDATPAGNAEPATAIAAGASSSSTRTGSSS